MHIKFSPIVCAISLLFSSYAWADGDGIQILDYASRPHQLPASTDATDASFAAFSEAIRRGVVESGAVGDRLSILRLPINLPDKHSAVSLESSISAPCIESPWAKLAVAEEGSVRRISGVVYWNERQFIRDRLPDKEWSTLPKPFSQSTFDSYAKVYATKMVKSAAETTHVSIPDDLEFLFRAAPQSTRGPFSYGAIGAMRRLAAGSAGAYTDQILMLIEYCVRGAPPLRLRGLGELKSAFGETAYINLQE